MNIRRHRRNAHKKADYYEPAMSFADIGRALGISYQAAQDAYRRAMRKIAANPDLKQLFALRSLAYQQADHRELGQAVWRREIRRA